MATIRELPYARPPREKQLEVLKKSLLKEEWGLYLDMSCGKTKVTIDTICYHANRGHIKAAMVFAPKALMHQWANDDHKKTYDDDEWSKDAWSDVRKTARVYVWGVNKNSLDLRKQAMFLEPHDGLSLVIMNTEAMSHKKGATWAKKFASKWRKAGLLVAVDEANDIKSHKAKRSRALQEVASYAKYKRVLTGTPMKNCPLDVFGLTTFLDTSIYGKSWFNFRARYARLKTEHAFGRSFTVVDGYQRLDELKEKLFSCGTRVEKHECVDLPPKIYMHATIEMGQEQERIYNEMRDNAVAFLDKMSDDQVVTASIALVQLNKLRQILCGFVMEDSGGLHWIKDNKRFDEVLKILDSIDGKVLLFSPYREVATEMVNRIQEVYGGGTAATYMGGTSGRGELQARFNNPKSKLDYLVCTQRSGKYGLNIRAAYCIYIANEYDLDVRMQSEDRAYGQGRGIEGVSTTYFDFEVPGTCDSKIVKMLVNKKRIADYLTGDKWRAFLTDKEQR
jgi:hypothetical protein